MRKRIYLLFFLTIGVLSFTHCVSPYYGTARIEPGPDINAGIAYTTGWPGWPSYVQGIRADIYAGQGHNKYLKTYLRASIGAGYETYDYGRTDENGFLPIFDAGVGLHSALDLGFATPAIVVELATYMGPSVSGCFMLGFGNREIITLGVRPHFTAMITDNYIPVDVFVSIHPINRLSLFAGAEVTAVSDYEPWITAGLGYRLSK